MRITTTQALFAWEALEDSPSLPTLREFLAAVPDAKLPDSLRQRRGQGRDDYPVSVLWGTLKDRCPARHEGRTCPSDGRRPRIVDRIPAELSDARAADGPRVRGKARRSFFLPTARPRRPPAPLATPNNATGFLLCATGCMHSVGSGRRVPLAHPCSPEPLDRAVSSRSARTSTWQGSRRSARSRATSRWCRRG